MENTNGDGGGATKSFIMKNVRIVKKQKKHIGEEEEGTEKREPAAKSGLNRGENLRVERGAEKKALEEGVSQGVDKGVMEERIINIIIN
jgi:hypothetical protein